MSERADFDVTDELTFHNVKIYKKRLLRALGLKRWPGEPLPTPRMHNMNSTLKSISKRLARVFRHAGDNQKAELDKLVVPRTQAEVELWQQLSVRPEKLKATLVQLAEEGVRRVNTYAEKQRRAQLKAGRRRHNRNGGSLAKKRAKTAHGMLMGRGRAGWSANRAKVLRGGRS
jgi:hypothetical protein